MPVTLLYTNGNWQTDNAEIVVSEVIPKGDGLYAVRLENARTDQRLFARLAASKAEGRLHVYPPVPGLSMTNNWGQLTKDQWTESPYYTYGVKKLSELNHTNFAMATNWETPFASFTRCVDYSAATNAYFDSYIGAWSHTYCNFELDPHTPIAIKIHRRTSAEMNSLGIVSQLSGLFTKLLTVGIYSVVYHAVAPWPDLPFWSPWYGALLALVFYDFCYYWQHRAGPEVAARAKS